MTGRELMRRPADGTVMLPLSGSVASVRSRLQRLDRDGLLVWADENYHVDRRTGHVTVNVRVLEHKRQARPEPTHSRTSPAVQVAVVAGGTVVALGVVWAVFEALVAVAPFLAVAVVALMLLGGGGCVTVVTVRHRH